MATDPCVQDGYRIIFGTKTSRKDDEKQRSENSDPEPCPTVSFCFHRRFPLPITGRGSNVFAQSVYPPQSRIARVRRFTVFFVTQTITDGYDNTDPVGSPPGPAVSLTLGPAASRSLDSTYNVLY